jgi:hypothetical protein
MHWRERERKLACCVYIKPEGTINSGVGIHMAEGGFCLLSMQCFCLCFFWLSSATIWPKECYSEKSQAGSVCSAVSHVNMLFVLMTSLLFGSGVAQWSKALHLSAKGVTTDTLVRIQTVSQLAVIGSLKRRRTIGPASSRIGRDRPSL